jgi:uncharacterized protein (DUF1015 family)
MADVRAFSGIHYNRSLLKDWRQVICPVYDIIPQGEHERLYGASDHNFVRLEAGRELPQDTPTDNKYTRAAAILEEWLIQGILETDSSPAIYVHDHHFEFGGRECTRRGLIARVRLEEWESRVVRPHESTLTEAKTDRLSLLWAIQANTSSIMSLYEDPGRDIAAVLDRQTARRPDIDLPFTGGEGHRVWAITEHASLQKIAAGFAGRALYIADGHHRYESALNYRRQRRSGSGAQDEQPFDFVMMTLIDFVDPGLLILPPHRLVRGIPRTAFDALRAKLEVFFNITEWRCDMPELWDRLGESLSQDPDVKLVLFGLGKDHVLVLQSKDPALIGSMMPYFHSELYKNLEVSIIDHVVLEKLLALSHDKDKMNLDYAYDRQDAVKRVLRGEYQLVFLLTPIKAETIKAVADLGEKMPKKSTYFYPKVPAGLLVNRLV